MANLTKILFPQAKQRSAVKLGISAYEIIRVWMQLVAFHVAPGLFSVVSTFEVNGACAPVVFLARNVISALEQQDLFAGGRQFVSQCASARARADNDYVVV